VKETMIQPDAEPLLEALGLEIPLIGLYDAPSAAPFEPCVRPGSGQRTCVFAYYKAWLRGETLHLTRDNYGCRGAASCLFSHDVRPRDELVEFLFEGEGLKRSRALTERYVAERHCHRPRHANVLIGPLRPDQYENLRAVTFLVDPDRLSALVIGAHYDAEPGEAPVMAPFGSGCSQLLGPSAAEPRAIIGATDAAMRAYLPPPTLAFTVNRPMFERLCALDEKSFLHKPFWKGLERARGRD
jgi:hypothetical protein